MFKLSTAAAGLLLCVSATSLSAATITYEMKGSGTYKLGASTFTSTFDIIGIGDSANVASENGGAVLINGSTTAFNLSAPFSVTATLGNQTVSFVDAGFVFVNGSLAGFGGNTQGDLLYITSPSLVGYDLASTFGPVSGVGSTPNQTVTTTGGLLSFTRVGDVTFSATTGASAVPEPASWAMMLVGFGAIGGVVRRRRVVFA